MVAFLIDQEVIKNDLILKMIDLIAMIKQNDRTV